MTQVGPSVAAQTEGKEAARSVGGKLEGKVALVTGANGGLGRSICRVLEQQGATVMSVDIAGDVDAVLDAGTREGCAEMVQRAVAEHGGLDILALNAGVQHVAPLPEFPEDQWDRIMDLHMKGPFLAIQSAWPQLTRQPGGRVVITASTSSFQAERNKVAYIASRHGVLGLMKVAALEGAPYGLTVNAVAPAWMRTPAVEAQLPEQMRLRRATREEVLTQLLNRHPVPRFVETDEVAATIAFLASNDSSGINGACIPVDLGTLAW